MTENRASNAVQTILDGATSTGAGTAINVQDFRFVVFLFSSDSSANATTKFQGSAQLSKPDFDSAASTSNHWDNISVKDLEDVADIAGDDGIVLSGSDDVRTVQANTDGISWVNADVTARSAGSITVKVIGYK